MIVADTDVFVYAADEYSPFHERCRERLEDLRKRPDAWYTTWAIVYEFLRVVAHPRVLERPWDLSQAWTFVSAVLASPGLGMLVATQRHPKVAEAVFAELPHLAGNILHDAHTAVLMHEHGISRILTRDTGFHRFPFLEPVDPMS